MQIVKTFPADEAYCIAGDVNLFTTFTGFLRNWPGANQAGISLIEANSSVIFTGCVRLFPGVSQAVRDSTEVRHSVISGTCQRMCRSHLPEQEIE